LYFPHPSSLIPHPSSLIPHFKKPTINSTTNQLNIKFVITMYRTLFKRLLDFTVALVALVVLLPLLAITTLFLAIANKGNPFFVQTRPGKDKKLFKIVKFKTMNDQCDVDGNLLSDEKRLTAIGSIVRKTSLDELPQLLNVLKGEMSLIGPRPLLVEYLPLYSKEQQKRHHVRPGITGWAQINGRNELSWQKKFELDVWYVQHVSFWLDLKIIVATIKKVIVREGISSTTSISMEQFKGN